MTGLTKIALLGALASTLVPQEAEYKVLYLDKDSTPKGPTKKRKSVKAARKQRRKNK